MQAGRIYFENGRLTDALSMFHQVVKLEPDNAQALYNLGSIYLSLQDKNYVQTYFSQAQVKWMKDPDKYPLPGVKPEDAKVWKERFFDKIKMFLSPLISMGYCIVTPA